MSGPKKKTPAARPRASSATTRRPASTHHRALLLIDNRPLQRAAWAEFHTARKRLEKTARDLHRHEEIDRPAYDAWLHRTFPVWVTTLRELYAEVSLKSHRVQTVLFMAGMTGRSPKKLWREQKEREANPEAFNDDEHTDDPFSDPSGDEKNRAIATLTFPTTTSSAMTNPLHTTTPTARLLLVRRIAIPHLHKPPKTSTAASSNTSTRIAAANGIPPANASGMKSSKLGPQATPTGSPASKSNGRPLTKSSAPTPPSAVCAAP